MTIETYIASLKHDAGTVRLKVVSLSGEDGAIQQIAATEGCPERAILKLKKINTKK
ncbi:MAG: hypothetical protein QHC79_10310 [Pseudosphingobacterium sp.]|nr:hypothetical protein [Pseudosphingobacterium sp.]